MSSLLRKLVALNRLDELAISPSIEVGRSDIIYHWRRRETRNRDSFGAVNRDT